MEKILYLPVETVVRDLDGNILLAHEAVKRNYAVVIGEISEVKKYAEYRGNGVYLFKHWEHNFPYDFDHEKRKNFCYVGFHPEGLVYADNEFLKNLNVTGKSEKLDLKFVYGEKQKNLLIQYNPLLRNIIHSVGHPRFDLLKPKYHSYYEKKVKRIRSKFGKYILVNTNFTIGNPASYYKKGLIERKNEESIKKWGKPLDESQRTFFEEAISHFHKLLEEYMKMIEYVSQNFPDLNIIVRPHPSENHQVYKKHFKNSDRINVIYEGNVVNWILGAAAVIQTGCTTGIETWATHKPAIRYNPIEDGDKLESDLPNKFGINSTNLEELEEILIKLEKNKLKNSFEEQKHIAKPFIESIEGELSVVKMMDLIDMTVDKKFPEANIGVNGIPIRQNSSFKKKGKEFYNMLIREIRSTDWMMNLRHGEKTAKDKSSYYQKFPGIKKSYIQNSVKALSKIEKSSIYKEVKIKKVDTDSFIIYKA